MTDPYDALMDHLATLAVEAVQRPALAIQAYWLMLLSQQAGQTVPLALDRLCTQPLLPAWARPHALQALRHIAQQGLWCESDARRLASQPLRQGTAVGSGQLTWCWTPAYLPYLDEVHDYTRRIWRAACNLYGPAPSHRTMPPDDLWRGAVLFDAGLYFACHEYFETLWGRTADAASDFYQGLIQIAVAMRHLESHNVRGAIILLRAGMGRLQRYPAVYKALQIARFLSQLAPLLAQLEALTEPTAYQFDSRQVPHLLESPEAGE